MRRFAAACTLLAVLACKREPIVTAPSEDPVAAPTVAEPAAIAEPAATEPAPDPVAPPPAPAPLEPTGSLVPAHAGSPTDRASESECERLHDPARDLLFGLTAPCEDAQDCELALSVCPFGCYAVVSKRADRRAAQGALDRYFRRCMPCKHKCRTTPSELVCVDGECRDPRDVRSPGVAP